MSRTSETWPIQAGNRAKEQERDEAGRERPVPGHEIPGAGPGRVPGSEPHADAIERALLEVRAMIEMTVEQHRDRVSWDQLITAVDDNREAIVAEARKLVHQTRTSIDVVLAAGPSCGAESKRALHELLRAVPEAVRIRLLCTPVMIDEDFVRAQRAREQPAEVRVARVPPLQGLIVDGTVGLVAAESPTGRRASLIRVPDVIRTLNTLYEGIWRNAVPADGHIAFGDHSRAELARQILGALRAGVTDEVAARELTVSVRTYRRYVAEIMSLLGASSRFQAGVRAAELGLLGSIDTP
ncbi:LuxR family transcriptional regulator [Streptomyces sp. NPDC001732]